MSIFHRVLRMRVGFFLLLSLGLHMAAEHWLHGEPRGSAAAAEAVALQLPVLMQSSRQKAEPPAEVPPAERISPPEKVLIRPAPARQPEPVAPEQQQILAPRPEARLAQAASEPVAEPAAEPADELPLQAVASTHKSADLAEPPQEVVSHAPRFREPPAPPRYPAQARRRSQQGQVLLEVRLDAQGTQHDVRLLRSSGFQSLDQAALTAVADWQFQPEVQAGRPVPSRVQIPIDFALNARR